jgi:hypothetical protein
LQAGSHLAFVDHRLGEALFLAGRRHC